MRPTTARVANLYTMALLAGSCQNGMVFSDSFVDGKELSKFVIILAQGCWCTLHKKVAVRVGSLFERGRIHQSTVDPQCV